MKLACSNCKASKTKCDDERPCRRCIRTDRAHTCADSERILPESESDEDDAEATAQNEQQQHALRQQQQLTAAAMQSFMSLPNGGFINGTMPMFTGSMMPVMPLSSSPSIYLSGSPIGPFPSVNGAPLMMPVQPSPPPPVAATVPTTSLPMTSEDRPGKKTKMQDKAPTVGSPHPPAGDSASVEAVKQEPGTVPSISASSTSAAEPSPTFRRSSMPFCSPSTPAGRNWLETLIMVALPHLHSWQAQVRQQQAQVDLKTGTPEQQAAAEKQLALVMKRVDWLHSFFRFMHKGGHAGDTTPRPDLTPTTLAAPKRLYGKLGESNGRPPEHVLRGGTTITLAVTADDFIFGLKHAIFLKTGLAPSEQRLVYAGKELKSDCTIADYDIYPGASLHLLLRLPGGGDQPLPPTAQSSSPSPLSTPSSTSDSSSTTTTTTPPIVAPKLRFQIFVVCQEHQPQPTQSPSRPLHVDAALLVYSNSPLGVLMFPLGPSNFEHHSSPWVNNSLTQLLGYQHSSQLETLFSSIDGIATFNPPSNLPNYIPQFIDAVMTGSNNYSTKTKWRHCAGHWVEMLESINFTYDQADGHVVYVASLMQVIQSPCSAPAPMPSMASALSPSMISGMMQTGLNAGMSMSNMVSMAQQFVPSMFQSTQPNQPSYFFPSNGPPPMGMTGYPMPSPPPYGMQQNYPNGPIQYTTGPPPNGATYHTIMQPNGQMPVQSPSSTSTPTSAAAPAGAMAR